MVRGNKVNVMNHEKQIVRNVTEGQQMIKIIVHD